MHSISIALGPIVWRLVFNTKEKAEEAEHLLSCISGVETIVMDDYGQRVRVRGDCVSGIMLEDLDRSKLAYVAMALHQTRAQGEAQKAVRADPALRALAGGQGPAVLTPAMNGGGF